MPRYESVAVTEQHIEDLAASLDDVDTKELWVLNHSTPYEGLRYSLDHSTQAWTFFDTTICQPLCIYGIQQLSLLPTVGSPWALSSRELARARWAFLRRSRQWIAEQRQNYTVLLNYVPHFHRRSRRWLQWLGFDEEESFRGGIELVYWHKIVLLGE